MHRLCRVLTMEIEGFLPTSVWAIPTDSTDLCFVTWSTLQPWQGGANHSRNFLGWPVQGRYRSFFIFMKFQGSRTNQCPLKWGKLFGTRTGCITKETWVTLSVGMLRKHMWTSEFSWASLNTLLHWSMVWTVGFAMLAWALPRRAAKSARVCVTAYWRLPTRPRSFDFSESVSGLSTSSLLALPTSIARIRWM